DGTAGQAAAGTTMSNGPFSLTGGFWNAALGVVSIGGKGMYRDTTTGGKKGMGNLTGSQTDMLTPLPDGLYTFNSEPAGGNYTVTPSKTDDVNGISGLDASRVLQATVGLVTLTPNQRIAADGNNNGAVTGVDASLILQKVVNIPNPISIVGTWKF